MSYRNSRHADRILNISGAEDLFGELSTIRKRGAVETSLAGSKPAQTIYITREPIPASGDRNIYNFPFLLNVDGTPWREANSFLVEQVASKHVLNRPTDDANRRAARLLDYKLFTEKNGMDWRDFSGRRLTSRPTYLYFKYLIEKRGLSPQVVNQYTSDVYRFYQFLSKNWYEIPMERVDSVKTIKVYFQTHAGARSVDRLKRSQTQSVPPTPKTLIGFVRDEGEVLRPLEDAEYTELKSIINSSQWSPIERLIMNFPIMTGARKQTVLTLRLKHIDRLVEAGPTKGKSFVLHAGPGTQIDTKSHKSQILYLPAQLVQELHTYAHSPQAKERRRKFKQRYEREYPDLEKIADEDIYLFLSDQGNCYFMAKDDPRYPTIKSPPRGQVVETLKRKLFKLASDDFPRDFYYHWLRATFASLKWTCLLPKIERGELSESDAISTIQVLLHHKVRETTENYLKLFKKMDKKLANQELFEDYLLPDSIVEKDVEA